MNFNIYKYTHFAFLAGCVMFFTLLASPLMAQQDALDILTENNIWRFFGNEGDAYSNIFLNQIFGDLFTSPGVPANTVFPDIVKFFNLLCMGVGVILVSYNFTIGTLQSANEGEILGKNWSSFWGPLRVLAAASMMAPILSGGYNPSQFIIAYIVKSSTSMASAIWSTTAELVISDKVAITAPEINFDPDLFTSLYRQAVCMAVAQYNVNVSSYGKHKMDYLKRESENAGVTYYSYINLGKDARITDYQRNQQTIEHQDIGICGSWSTPPVPQYLLGVKKRSAETANTNDESQMSPADAAGIINRFYEGHEEIMRYVADELYKVLYGRVTYNWGGDHLTYNGEGGVVPKTFVEEDNAPIGDNFFSKVKIANLAYTGTIQEDIIRIHGDANDMLAALIKEIQEKVGGFDNLEHDRKTLLKRITGDSSCTKENARTYCYGEGWLGAGAWYILMAKFNNELSSIIDAHGKAKLPTYDTSRIEFIPGGYTQNRHGHVDRVKIGFLFLKRDANEAEKENSRMLYSLNTIYDRSVVSFAVKGFPVPKSILVGINEELSDDGDFWDDIFTSEEMTETSEAIIRYFDPASQGGDPMIALMGLGSWLINIAFTIMGGVALISGVYGAVMAFPFFSIILAAGASLQFILPMIPFLYWVLAIMGYFLLIIEAIVAVNLWALSHMRMDGEGLSGPAGQKGWLMTLALFMTPSLMMFGFIIGMILFRVMSNLISFGIFNVMSSTITTNPFIWVTGMVAYSILIVSIYILLLERSFSLVAEFPDRVMRWMGEGVNIAQGQERVQIAAGAAATGINAMGNTVEKVVPAGGVFTGMGARLLNKKMGKKGSVTEK